MTEPLDLDTAKKNATTFKGHGDKTRLRLL